MQTDDEQVSATDDTTRTGPRGCEADQPATEADLHRRLHEEHIVALWTEIGDLMPVEPASRAIPHIWRWSDLLPIAELAGELVPVGRGGERRALALANPGLAGRPFATPTIWAAIQFLNAGEHAPEHRHTQHAFRFVVEGEGVWTLVNGDAVKMCRGDFLPQPGWNWHAHHNQSTRSMAWIDGLDIPLQSWLESTFFEYGRDHVPPIDLSERSRSERLWGQPGLHPVTRMPISTSTPLLAYRWEHTDRVLTAQLELEADGFPSTVEPGHAVVRYANPTSGHDVLPTMRIDFHRLVPGTQTAPSREVGSSVFQVFDGSARVTVDDESWDVGRGDLFVVPSWGTWSIECENESIDVFRFCDAPVYEALGLAHAPRGVDNISNKEHGS